MRFCLLPLRYGSSERELIFSIMKNDSNENAKRQLSPGFYKSSKAFEKTYKSSEKKMVKNQVEEMNDASSL